MIKVNDLLKLTDRAGAKLFVRDNGIAVRILDSRSGYGDREVYTVEGFNRACDCTKNAVIVYVR